MAYHDYEYFTVSHKSYITMSERGRVYIRERDYGENEKRLDRLLVNLTFPFMIPWLRSNKKFRLSPSLLRSFFLPDSVNMDV